MTDKLKWARFRRIAGRAWKVARLLRELKSGGFFFTAMRFIFVLRTEAVRTSRNKLCGWLKRKLRHFVNLLWPQKQSVVIGEY